MKLGQWRLPILMVLCTILLFGQEGQEFTGRVTDSTGAATETITVNSNSVVDFERANRGEVVENTLVTESRSRGAIRTYFRS